MSADARSGRGLRRQALFARFAMALLAAACLLLPLNSRADIVYVTMNNTVEKFTAANAGSLFASTAPKNPRSLAFDRAGNLYVTTQDVTGFGTIEKFTSTGVHTLFASTGAATCPEGLAFDAAGNLFVANGCSNTVVKFTPAGVSSTFVNVTTPAGLAFDQAGNLYVSSQINGSIEKFTPSGVHSTFATGLNGAYGLAFDNAGNLYASNENDNTIQKFTPSGMGSIFASSGLNLPEGLAFDSAGNLYAVNFSGEIVKFTPTGSHSSFATGLGRGALGIAIQPGTLPVAGAEVSNISTRLEVLTGDNVSIAGFIISGTEAKKVLLRGIGPTLGQFGIQNPLLDPTLTLLQNSTVLTSNDNWKNTQTAEIEATGKAPLSDFEAAIIRSLTPGNYTAVMAGKNNTTGVGLVEAYDLDPNSNSTLTNISTRGFVGTGTDVMIGGFITSTGNVNVLVRALGPTLTQFGVNNVLADPTLTLVDANGTLLYSNDNWKNTQQAQIQATGLAPPNDAESAILITRPPGNTTAVLSGKNNTSGVAIVEVYKLP